jgi:putative redox protein
MPASPETTVDLTWERGFKFTSSDRFGHSVTVDAPEEGGPAFDGFKPGELLLTSLAACSGIDVVGILKRQRQRVTGVGIRVRGTQLPDPPWTWTDVELTYTVTGHGLTAAAVERAIHLSETKYCSVGATLSPQVSITSSFEIIEESVASDD